MITREDVIHISKLAKVELKEDEIEKFREGFQNILEYFNILDEVEEDVEPTFQVLPLRNVFREDVPKRSLGQERVLMNAKHVEEGYFKGPRVVE
ncbi:Asp-tRNA(Asn)/Glu-tRNA(Gln) amidotransferase GatCAB subunit C [Archaeoglobales archaeon]|nr:MAG: Asp-tRNA(Asn)/Glu-tRNA(Gln) amidotransferase GatCAB subunit C [Archaeoglobales archaeon]